MAALSHPHILAIHDFGRDRRIVYAVMELLEGQTLRERLGRRAAAGAQGDRDRAADRAGPGRGAREGHRPPRPQARQRVPDDRRPREDSGLRSGEGASKSRPMPAKQSPPRRDDTTPGMVVGTIGYMSPEQVKRCARRSAHRHLCLRGDRLRDARPAVRVRSREQRRNDCRDPARRRPGRSRGGWEFRRRSSASCAAAWKRSPPSAFTPRTISASPSKPCSTARRRHPATTVAVGPAPARRAGLAIVATAAIAASPSWLWPGSLWSGGRRARPPSDSRVRKFHVAAQRLVVDRAAAAGHLAGRPEDRLRRQRQPVGPGAESTGSTAARPELAAVRISSGLPTARSSDSCRKRSCGRCPSAGGQPIALGDVPSAGGGAAAPGARTGGSCSRAASAAVACSSCRRTAARHDRSRRCRPGTCDFHEPSLLPDDDGQLIVVHRTRRAGYHRRRSAARRERRCCACRGNTSPSRNTPRPAT